jgi:hypothetical protein
MSYRDAKLVVDTRLGDGLISSMKDSQKQIQKTLTKKEKSKNEDSEDKKDEESDEGSVDMRSGINMAGTSMGSYDKPMMGGYDKPMMKGGYDKPMMKSGCQISKHMGGRGAAMMGKKSCK